MKTWAGTVLALLGLGWTALAADWPQWLGPQRNGASAETGLLDSWPADGPKVLWKVPGGDGYSSIAVVGGKAFTLVQRDGAEWAIALDAAKGTELWKQKIGPIFKNDYGNGPRSTPTVEGDRVYVQSVSGPLVCLDAVKGSIHWQKDILKEFGAKNITWGLCASPLVVGDLVFAEPGAKGAGVAAFNKKDGSLAWKTSDDKAAYASPVLVKAGGEPQVVFFTAAGLRAVSPDKGQTQWQIPWATEFDCNIATPLVVGDKLFVSSGEKVGCALLQLSASGAPQPVWQGKSKKSPLTTYWATAVEHQGHLYGMNGEFDKQIDLRCVDLKTGQVKWSKDFGKASVLLADGHLYLTTKSGDLVLVKATPESYQERSRVKLLGDNRTVPTLSNGRLYVRDRENILCLEVKK